MPTLATASPSAGNAPQNAPDASGGISPAPRAALPADRLHGLFLGESEFFSTLGPEASQTVRQRMESVPNPVQERQRLANTVFLADRFGLSAQEVAGQYDTLRASYARQMFPDVPAIADEGVFFSAVAKQLQTEAQERTALGELNATLFEAALNGQDFKTAWETAQSAGAGVIAKQRADVFNAWAIDRWEANRASVAKLKPAIDEAVAFLSAYRAKENGGTEDHAALRESLMDRLTALDQGERATVLAMASRKAQETAAPERSAVQATFGVLAEGTVDLVEGALAGLWNSADALSTLQGLPAPSSSALGQRIKTRLDVERQFQQLISGEVDPITGDTFAGQVALDFVRGTPAMLAALTPAGLAVDFLALKQNAREALEAQGATPGQAEGIAAIQAVPQTALFFAQSKMVFLGKVPAGFGKNLGTTLATEYVGNLLLNEAGYLSDAGIQSIAAAMSESVPEVDWQQFGQSFKERLPHSLALAIPGALIGTGVATFKNPKAGQVYLQQPELLEDLGFTPEAREAVMQAETPEATEAAFKQGFAARDSAPPPQPPPGPTVEPLGRRYLVAEGVGEPVAQFQVKQPGEARGVTMTAEQVTAAGLTVPPDTLTEIATVQSMDGAAFKAWSRQQKGGFTTTAHNLGQQVKSAREVNALLRAQIEAEVQLDEAMAMARKGDMDAMNESMLLSTKAQFFREAYEAALGVLSAGDHLRKDPSYRPPIVRNPDGSYSVQAVADAPPVQAATPEGAAMVAEAQRTEAAQTAATAAPEPHPEQDGRALPPRITALNKDSIAALRALFNLDELDAPTRERFVQVLDEAKRTDMAASADQLAADILVTKRVSSATEHAAMVLRSAQLQNQYEDIAQRIGDAFARGDADAAAALKQTADNVLGQLDAITEASDRAGTEIARALSIRRMRLNRDDYTLARVVQRARTAAQRALSVEEQTQLKALTDDMVEQQRIIAEQRAALQAKDVELAKANAETFVAEGRSRRRSASAQNARERRQALKRELVALGYRVNDITNVIGLNVELARIVAKMADTYIEEGVASLTELTNKLKADVPDLSDQDIYMAVGRQTQKQAAKIESEAKRRVKELRTQAALWAKIDAALMGLRLDGSPMNRQQRHKLLRETLRELRQQANRTTFDDAALKRVDAKILEIQRQLAAGERALRTPERKRPAENEQLKGARQTLKELRQEMGALETIDELESLVGEETAPAQPGQPQEPVRPPNQRLNALRERIAELRDQIDQAQVDPAAVNAERLARLQRMTAEVEAQIEGGFRVVPESRGGVVAADAAVEAARRQLRDLQRLMRTEDAIADLNEQIRTGDYKVSVPEQRILTNAKLERALIRQRQLRRQVDELIDHKRKLTLGEGIVQALLVPRTLLATGEMSATLRQGLLLSASRPAEALRTFRASFKALLSEETADAIAIALQQRPLFLEGERSGLFLSEIGGGIRAREEHFLSNWLQRVPGVRQVVNASERSMVTTLNLLRVAAFDGFIQAHPEATFDQRKAYARYVNAASGRGNVKWSPSTVKALNTVFFAPRYAVSRFQALASPFANWKDPMVRNAILKDFGALIGTGSSVLVLAALAGAEVSLDPSESDFGKIVIDETRVDIWGGLQQPARLVLQAALAGPQRAEMVDLENDIDPLDAALRFTSYKLSPAVTVPLALWEGENIIGQEQGAGETVLRAGVPLSYQETVDVGVENESIAAALAAFGASGLGLGVQQHE